MLAGRAKPHSRTPSHSSMPSGPSTRLGAEPLLVFQVGSGRYGVRLSALREVLRAVAITLLPGAPRVVEGVIDVRGEVVPVLNMRRRFGAPERPLDPAERFVLVRAGERSVALRVDSVAALADADPAAEESAETLVPGAPHVAGVARLADGLVLIHDPDAFLTQAESAELEAALARLPQAGEP